MKNFINMILILTVIFCVSTVNAQVIINEVDSDQAGFDSTEFIELFDGGTGGTALDGLVLVLFTGFSDTSYRTIDLNGYVTDANGYFVIGSTGMGTDIEISPGAMGWLEHGGDAVAVYADIAASFPDGTPVTSTNLIDALVYDSDGSPANVLVTTLLNAGELQINENENGTADYESMGRCPNGSGGAMNTYTYSWDAPSPGSGNVCILATPTPTPTVTPTFPPAPACDQEYIVNGDMENWFVSGPSGPPDDWSLTAAFGSTLTAEQSTTEVHSGISSVLVSKTNSGANDRGLIEQYIGTYVLPDTIYVLSGWFLDNDYHGNVHMWIRWFDSTGLLVAYSGSTADSVDMAVWQELSTAAVSPSDAVFVDIRISFEDGDGGPVSIYMDDISLVAPCSPVPTPSPTSTIAPTPTPTMAPCDANIIANPSFETWSGTSPDDWFGEIGILTNQNALNPHKDLLAVELTNALSGTDYTSGYVPVNPGGLYEAGMWIIDNDPDVNAQFYVLFYNSDFYWVESTDWLFTSGASTDYQEMNTGLFWVPINARWARMRVRFVDNNGDPPSTSASLTIDDAWLDEPCSEPTPTPTAVPTAAVTRSIYEIQFSSPPGASPYAGSIVRTSGIVTAVELGNPYVFIQDFANYWGGLMIYIPTGPGTLEKGDSIIVQGLVEEIDGMTAITNPGMITVVSSGNPLPAALTVSPLVMKSEEYESVRVIVENVDITAVNISEGEWTILNGLDDAIVDNLYSYTYVPSVGEHVDWVQGPVMEVSGVYKLQPRDDNDISATFVPLPSTGLAGVMILIAVFGLILFRKGR